MPPGFYLGLVLYVMGWLTLHFLSGTYHSLYQKSRLTEFLKTLSVSLIGCLVLLFFFILKNPQENNRNYYFEFFSLLIPFFTCTILVRMVFLSIVKKQLKEKKVFFNALLIGPEKKATLFYNAFQQSKEHSGYRITGFINTNGSHGNGLPESVKRYQGTSGIIKIIDEDAIEEVIIAVEKNERDLITSILQ